MREPTAATRRYLTTKELCERWGVSPSTLWRGQKAGRYPQPRQIGLRRKGYDIDEVQSCEQGWRPAQTREDAFPLPASFQRKTAKRGSVANSLGTKVIQKLEKGVKNSAAAGGEPSKRNRPRWERERLIDKERL